jgi:hypothetical protein
MMAIAWKEAVRSSLRAEKIAPARRCAPGRAFLALSVAPEPLNNNRSLSSKGRNARSGSKPADYSVTAMSAFVSCRHTAMHALVGNGPSH